MDGWRRERVSHKSALAVFTLVTTSLNAMSVIEWKLMNALHYASSELRALPNV